MELNRRALLGGAAGAALGGLPFRSARAQAANTIKIALLCDFSGTYRDVTGPTELACVRQAAAEMSNRGFNIEVLYGDNQNKPDVGSNLTRQWIDQGVDVIVDGGASSVALAVNELTREKNKVFLNSSSATSDLTGSKCSPNTVHWTYDTYMCAKSTGGALVRAGGDSWYFVTADYAFGHALERDTANFVKQAGGTVVGNVRHPFPNSDFSGFLVQAQASRAKVIGFANAGSDTINCIKQAAEFGITRRGTKLAALLMFINDVHALGLQVAQGLVCTETFYWDLNDRTRSFTNRVKAATNNAPLCMNHAGGYASVLHYLKAVSDMGVAAAKANGVDAVNRMKAMPTNDDCFGPGSIRQDGRKLHPAYLLEVKKPEESKHQYDYFKVLGVTQPNDVFRPLAEGGCAFIRS